MEKWGKTAISEQDGEDIEIAVFMMASVSSTAESPLPYQQLSPLGDHVPRSDRRDLMVHATKALAKEEDGMGSGSKEKHGEGMPRSGLVNAACTIRACADSQCPENTKLRKNRRLIILMNVFVWYNSELQLCIH